MKKRFVLRFFIIIITIITLSSCGGNNTQEQNEGAAAAYDKIAVIAGSDYDKTVWEKFPESSIFYCNSSSDALLALKAGRADAYLDDEPLMKKAIASDESLKILSPPIARSDYAVVVNKDNKELQNDLNEFLEAIRADGTYADMSERWTEAAEPVDMPEIHGTTENGTLVLGTTGGVDGFTYYKNGELTGFDIELAKRFAAYKGMGLEIIVMDFGALIPSVIADRIDFAAAVISITEERKETVGFSDPYFSLNVSLCVLSGEAEPVSSSFLVDAREMFMRNLVVESRWQMIMSGLGITLIISLFSFVFGTALGCFVCWMNTCETRAVVIIGKIYVTLLCSTPVVVLLMVIYYVVFVEIDINTIFVAIIAYSLSEGAYIGDLFHRAVLSVDRGQLEAARSMGFSKTGAFFAVTLPQSVSVALPSYKSELSALIKATSVVGYIAVIDVTKAADIIRGRTYDAFFPLLLVTLIYLLLTGAIVLVFELINRLTNKKVRKRESV